MKKNRNFLVGIASALVILFPMQASDKTVASYMLGDYARYLPSSQSVSHLAGKVQGWAKVVGMAAQDPRAQNAGIVVGKSEQESKEYAQFVADQAKQVQELTGYVNQAAAINQDPIMWGLNKTSNTLLDSIAPSVFKDIDDAVKKQLFGSIKDVSGYDLRQLYEYLVAIGIIKSVSSKDPGKWLAKNWINPQIKKLITASLGYVPSFSDVKNYIIGLVVSSNLPAGQEVALEKDGSQGEQIQVFTSKGGITGAEQKILHEILKSTRDMKK